MCVREVNVLQRCLYVFKTLHSTVPGQIYPTEREHRYDTRGKNMPLVNLARLALTEQRITVQGVTLFNNLPANIRDTEQISRFKTNLYDFLKNEIVYSHMK